MRRCRSIVLGLFWLASFGTTQAAQRTLNAVKTPAPPQVDGFIESVWASADSVTGFVQTTPDEGQPATEKTVAYLLYDDQNLYVAFKCYDSQPEKLDLRVMPRDQKGGDEVYLFLDPFDDKTTGYLFYVNAKGGQYDAYISSDGRSEDSGWDGVWYSAARTTAFGYVVEIKIPFRSIRFKRGLLRWGINFSRYISRKEEQSHWAPQKREEGFRVSRSGQLVGFQAGEAGLHLEAYPVSLIRYEEASTALHSGVDLGWYPTPSSGFRFTVNPDFAQVEADPSRINLSKYELYFAERRPFFIEDAEIFRPSRGLELFYSRRIGRRLPGGKDVPILGASKFTGRFGKLQLGALGAVTDRTEYPGEDTPLVEPRSYYSVFRLEKRFLENSSWGILYVGKEAEAAFNQVLSLDGALRTKKLQFSFQGAYAHKEGTGGGYAGQLELGGETRGISMFFQYKNIGRNFDVSGVGFAPWRRREYYFGLSPVFWQKGIFRRILLGPGITIRREYGDPGASTFFAATFRFWFTNNWGIMLTPMIAKRYNMGKWYEARSISANVWTDRSKAVSGAFYFRYHTREPNYRRGYIAPAGSVGVPITWQVNSGFSLNASAWGTFEFKPDGSVENVSWIVHPAMQYALRKDLHLRVWSEPNTDTHIHRLNLLLSWNFRPKSWMYLAWNETRDNTQGDMRLKDRIMILKVRYLFFL